MQGAQTAIQDTDLKLFVILTINTSIGSDPSVHDTQHESGGRSKTSCTLQHNCGSLASDAGKDCTPQHTGRLGQSVRISTGEESMGRRVPHLVQTVLPSGNLRTVLISPNHTALIIASPSDLTPSINTRRPFTRNRPSAKSCTARG